MSEEIDFVPFATGVGANVESQATFLADPSTAAGFSAGIAKSASVNKVLRQGSFVAAAIATFVSEVLNINVLDDGNLSEFVGNFTSAVEAVSPFRGIQSTGEQDLTASTGLTPSMAGANLIITTGGITLTFPGGAETFWLNNASSGAVTLVFPSGSDFRTTLYAGERIGLSGNGSGYWRVIAGANLSGLQAVTVEFSTPGAFSLAVPANAIGAAQVVMTGGGGGGGGATTALGGGGGASAATAIAGVTLTPGGTFSGTIGAGGAGGSAGANGSDGGATTVGSMTAGGGGGGHSGIGSCAGGIPGTASGAQANIPGGPGTDGNTASNVTPWACGGASYWGGGGRAGAGGGVPGVAPGSGGGAGYDANCAGGVGANGCAVLTYWIH